MRAFRILHRSFLPSYTRRNGVDVLLLIDKVVGRLVFGLDLAGQRQDKITKSASVATPTIREDEPSLREIHLELGRSGLQSGWP